LKVQLVISLSIESWWNLMEIVVVVTTSCSGVRARRLKLLQLDAIIKQKKRLFEAV
jgi:hypothetical protein